MSEASPAARATSTRRPVALLALVGLAGCLSIFDQVITVSSIPFMRNPAALITALALGLYVWYRRDGLPLHRGAQRWMIAFLLYTAALEFARGLWTGEMQLLRYMQWGQVLVLAIVVVDLGRDRRAVTLIWGGIIAAVLFMGVSTTVGLPVFTRIEEGRVGFAGVNLNAQGYWSALAATTVLWWLLERWPRFGWRGAVGLLAFAVLVLALVETASRGALLALVVGLLSVLGFSLRSRNLSAYATLVPLAVLALAFFVADATVLQDRFSDALSGEDLGARDSIAIHGVALLTQEPWFGHGPAFQETLGEARGMNRAISSHNSYLQVALTFGLPAFVLWASIMVSVLTRVWHAWSGGEPLGSLMFGLIAASLVFGLVGDLGFNKFFWTMIALASQTPVPVASHSPAPPPLRPGARAMVRTATSPSAQVRGL